MNEPMIITVRKSQAFLGKIQGARRTEPVVFGKFFLRLEIIAMKEALYIPISIASGRRSTGFIYLIEGTAESDPTAGVTCRGDGVSIVTSGSIAYAKIPPGKTAMFEIRAHVNGVRGKIYKLVLSRINYKQNPNDIRYKRFLTELSTDSVKFK